MAERKPGTKATQKSAKSTTAIGKTSKGFTDEEPRRRRHVAGRLRANGVDRRRRGKDRRARQESGELRTQLATHETDALRIQVTSVSSSWGMVFKQ